MSTRSAPEQARPGEPRLLLRYTAQAVRAAARYPRASCTGPASPVTASHQEGSTPCLAALASCQIGSGFHHAKADCHGRWQLLLAGMLNPHKTPISILELTRGFPIAAAVQGIGGYFLVGSLAESPEKYFSLLSDAGGVQCSAASEATPSRLCRNPVS